MSEEEYLAWLQEVHSADIGHEGVNRTIDKLKKAGRVWPHMTEDELCKGFSRAAYYPIEVLSIDTAGPLLEDGDSAKYISEVVDNFTHWIEL